MILLNVNNEVLFIIAVIVAMLLVIAFFSVYLFFLFQKRKIRLLQQQQAMKENYEQEILKIQIEIRDQAMNDVGRELHDHISQVMTLIKLNINLLSHKGLAADDEKRLADTKDLVKETISDIRMLSKTLNGDLVAETGIVNSIQYELDRINRLNVINCRLQVEGDQYDIPANTAFVLFRIMQENLHNILKHSRCKNVTTKLFFTDNYLTLTQQDDGIGFNMEEANLQPIKGSGLTNMQRRAAVINADLVINSEAGKGTELVVKVLNYDYKAHDLEL